MNYEERNLENKGYRRFRNGLNIGMGILYIIMGCGVVYLEHFGAMPLGKGASYALGGLMVVYGIFRLWRGFYDQRREA